MNAQVRCRQGESGVSEKEGVCLQADIQEWVVQKSEAAKGWGRCSRCPSHSLVPLPIPSMPTQGQGLMVALSSWAVRL